MMTKSQIVAHLAEKVGIPKNTAAAVLVELVTVATKEAKSSGQFVVPGLGKAVKANRKARMGRNPQTGEAIKILSGVGEPLSGKLLLWNALTMNVQTVRLAADQNSRPIRELPADSDAAACSSESLEIDSVELRRLLGAGPVQLLDVREDWERSEDAIHPSLHVPLGMLEEASSHRLLAGLRAALPTVVYCAAGVRSLVAVAILRESYGLRTAKSLLGGMHAWRAPG